MNKIFISSLPKNRGTRWGWRMMVAYKEAVNSVMKVPSEKEDICPHR